MRAFVFTGRYAVKSLPAGKDSNPAGNPADIELPTSEPKELPKIPLDRVADRTGPFRPDYSQPIEAVWAGNGAGIGEEAWPQLNHTLRENITKFPKHLSNELQAQGERILDEAKQHQAAGRWPGGRSALYRMCVKTRRFIHRDLDRYNNDCNKIAARYGIQNKELSKVTVTTSSPSPLYSGGYWSDYVGGGRAAEVEATTKAAQGLSFKSGAAVAAGFAGVVLGILALSPRER